MCIKGIGFRENELTKLMITMEDWEKLKTIRSSWESGSCLRIEVLYISNLLLCRPIYLECPWQTSRQSKVVELLAQWNTSTLSLSLIFSLEILRTCVVADDRMDEVCEYSYSGEPPQLSHELVGNPLHPQRLVFQFFFISVSGRRGMVVGQAWSVWMRMSSSHMPESV